METPFSPPKLSPSTRRVAGILRGIQQQLREAKQERLWLQEQLEKAAQERLALTNLLYEVLEELRQLNAESAPSEWPSEVGMDYSYLQSCLAQGDWEQANEYTGLLLLALAGYESTEMLSLEEIEALPRVDMDTLDRLWWEYSEGRFGFRVQESIWQEVNRDYGLFCDRLGWRIQLNWLSARQLTFSLSAPVGHLPAIIWRNRACYGLGFYSPTEVLETIFAIFDSTT